MGLRGQADEAAAEHLVRATIVIMAFAQPASASTSRSD
jgi:hypothetical protein